MATDSVSQAEHSKQHVNELLVCQMRALIRELWPDEFDVKPELTLLQGGKVARHG